MDTRLPGRHSPFARRYGCTNAFTPGTPMVCASPIEPGTPVPACAAAPACRPGCGLAGPQESLLGRESSAAAPGARAADPLLAARLGRRGSSASRWSGPQERRTGPGAAAAPSTTASTAPAVPTGVAWPGCAFAGPQESRLGRGSSAACPGTLGRDDSLAADAPGTLDRLGRLDAWLGRLDADGGELGARCAGTSAISCIALSCVAVQGLNDFLNRFACKAAALEPACACG